MVVQTCNPSIPEAEARGLGFQGKSVLHSEFKPSLNVEGDPVSKKRKTK
jgi:hypothetical protein